MRQRPDTKHRKNSSCQHHSKQHLSNLHNLCKYNKFALRLHWHPRLIGVSSRTSSRFGLFEVIRRDFPHADAYESAGHLLYGGLDERPSFAAGLLKLLYGVGALHVRGRTVYLPAEALREDRPQGEG